MLENYEQLPNGVIQQINRSPFSYGADYSGAYNKLGEIGNRMSYLRLGYLLGVIKEIPDSILDIGYGNGSFLAAASTAIQNCYGSDVSDAYPLPNGLTYVESPYDNYYDVVTMFDVLEHFDDIYDIKNLNCKYLFVSMPWCHYFSDDWFANWKHRKPNEHLYHFNGVSLYTFMDEIGFDVIDISNIEDCIRKPVDNNKNILSGIFKKR
jgi:hypothetical protein